jgi:UDPglucose 6-dehydrogenase
MADKIIAACGGSVEGKKIAILGLTFKPNTDDMRDSPSLAIVPALVKGGANVHAFDPQGMDEARTMIEGIEWCDGAYEALDGADVVAIVTEWNEFRALDLERMKSTMAHPVMVDLRNIYNPDEMTATGFDYHCIGRTVSNGN